MKTLAAGAASASIDDGAGWGQCMAVCPTGGISIKGRTFFRQIFTPLPTRDTAAGYAPAPDGNLGPSRNLYALAPACPAASFCLSGSAGSTDLVIHCT